MNVSNDRLPGGVKTQTIWAWAALLLIALILAGCGGGGAAGGGGIDPLPIACDPSDPGTVSECGTLIIGLTDDDGDFLNYTVDVKSLTLEKASGAIVQALPNKTRINFAEYVGMTEFISAQTVSPGIFVSGTIRLDYSNAEIVVDAGGESKPATVVDDLGNALGEAEFKIILAETDRLVVRKGLPSVLTVDFDLGASHMVDTVPTPAVATAEPFIVAEIDPVDTKGIRVRGLFVDANVEEMYYTIAIRPFYDRVGDFGRFKVHITDDTKFGVNGEEFAGSDGLRALLDAGRGTLTVAQGELNLLRRHFVADIVLAGTSVPGHDRDAAKGNVISRNGDTFVVRGATIIRPDRDAYFHDDVVVTVGPDTKVFKHWRRDSLAPDILLDNSAISVGQKVTVIGDVTISDAARIHIDATNGVVRMHLTNLSGIVNSVVPFQTDITLHAIDGRRASIFDFEGTGPSPAEDADPANYEIATGNLFPDSNLMTVAGVGHPVVAKGFQTPFGSAPPDFQGRTMIDVSDVTSWLGVGWGMEGTLEPFLRMDEDGLLLWNMNPDIDQRHYVKQGPVLIDLTALDSDTLIVPRETGRMLFVIKTTDSLQQYSVFADFVDHLTLELGGGSTARSMFARGRYNADTNVFTAFKIGIFLLEP